MDYDRIDYTLPIMFEDGRFARYERRVGGTDVLVGYYDGADWKTAWYSCRGRHIRHSHEELLPNIMYQPEVSMDQPLYWMDDGERAFVRETFYDEATGHITGYSVDDPTGRLFHVLPGGEVQGLPPRVLANVPMHQQQAEASVAIKRAQRERQLEREQAALDQLADLNPTLFGAF